MEIKRQEGTEVRLGTINNHELASVLNHLIPSDVRDEGYIIDPNSMAVDSSGPVDRMQVSLRKTSHSDRSAEPNASDVQRMRADIPPRLPHEGRE